MSVNALKLAIIGGGPSAFYTASRVLKTLPDAANARVHIFDRLWAPHGLVRYGVAPDHPEVKNCTHKFDATAADPRFQFFGNVEISHGSPPPPPKISHALPLPLSSLFKSYTHVLFATGCTESTLHPTLPPVYPYCIPALDVVHWYTHHPSSSSLSHSTLVPTIDRAPPLQRARHVSLIGNGNVSLDVARILLTPHGELGAWDLPRRVVDVLRDSKVEHVSIIGRRGPLEAAFTVKELREMMNLPDAAMVPLESSMLDTVEAAAGAKGMTRQQSRVMQLLRKGSKNVFGSTRKTWSLDFFRAPVGYSLGSSPSPSSTDTHSNLLSLALSHTRLDPTTHLSVPTGLTTTHPTDLIITSLGFHSPPSPLPFYDPGLRHLRTVQGRVITASGRRVERVYASGWAAGGAKGVLAGTMMDAYGVGDEIVRDWTNSLASSSEGEGTNGNVSEKMVTADEELSELPFPLSRTMPPRELSLPPPEIREALKDQLGPSASLTPARVTTYDDWKRIDQEEVRRGQAAGKERERMGWSDVVKFLWPN